MVNLTPNDTQPSVPLSTHDPHFLEIIAQLEQNVNDLKVHYNQCERERNVPPNVEEWRNRAQLLEQKYQQVKRNSSRVADKNRRLAIEVEDLRIRLTHVTEERDAAWKTLRRYRRVIRDAFESEDIVHDIEQDDDSETVGSDGEESNRGIQREAQLDHDESEADAQEVSDQLLARSLHTASSFPTPVAGPSRLPIINDRNGRWGRGGVYSARSSDDSPPTEVTMIEDYPEGASSLGLSISGSHDDVELDETWKIGYTHPPRASNVKAGPISWKYMTRRVGLDEEKVLNLLCVLLFYTNGLMRIKGNFPQKVLSPSIPALVVTDSNDARLLESPEFGLRVQFMEDQAFAFVHEPIILEDVDGKRSYFIDWADENRNRKLIQQIRDAGTRCNYTFHTFIFLSGRVS
ncbi:hypothetical protein VNI00_001224 [Paramarasmius palmivorus]|uniref:Uncharacterized protein n=1 Tax=Paramarasmius palmivorus TaxID=297713 RepID=A0AAW0EBC9_9AGAR